MKRIIIVIALLALAACATQTITSGPAPVIQSKTVANDFLATATNLNAAVAAGIIPATDPTVTCANNAVSVFNLAPPAANAPAPASFTVTNAGIISAGSIAYIKFMKANNAAPITVSTNCEQLLGHLQVMGLAAVQNPVGTIENILGLPKIQ